MSRCHGPVVATLDPAGRVVVLVDEAQREGAVVLPGRLGQRSRGSARPASTLVTTNLSRAVVLRVHDRGEAGVGPGAGSSALPAPSTFVTTAVTRPLASVTGVVVIVGGVVAGGSVAGAARRTVAVEGPRWWAARCVGTTPRSSWTVTGSMPRWPEPEQAAAASIDEHRDRDEPSPTLHDGDDAASAPTQGLEVGESRRALRAASAAISSIGPCSTSAPARGSTDPTGCTRWSRRSRPRSSASSSTPSSPPVPASAGTTCVAADAEEFDLGRSFEVVWAGEIIEHLSCAGGFLDAARRHLEPGGRLVITTPNAFAVSNFVYRIGGRPRDQQGPHLLVRRGDALATVATPRVRGRGGVVSGAPHARVAAARCSPARCDRCCPLISRRTRCSSWRPRPEPATGRSAASPHRRDHERAAPLRRRRRARLARAAGAIGAEQHGRRPRANGRSASSSSSVQPVMPSGCFFTGFFFAAAPVFFLAAAARRFLAWPRPGASRCAAAARFLAAALSGFFFLRLLPLGGLLLQRLLRGLDRRLAELLGDDAGVRPEVALEPRLALRGGERRAPDDSSACAAWRPARCERPGRACNSARAVLRATTAPAGASNSGAATLIASTMAAMARLRFRPNPRLRMSLLPAPTPGRRRPRIGQAERRRVDGETGATRRLHRPRRAARRR